MKSLAYCLTLISLILVPCLVSAQSSRPAKTEKLFLNVHLNGNYLNVEGGDPVGGRGLGIQAGYGFSRLFTLYLGLDGATMNSTSFGSTNNANDFGLGYFELGGHFNFQTSKPAAIPYANVALSAQAAIFNNGSSSDLTYSGGGLTLGGGLKYFVSKTLALDFGLDFTFGNFSEVEFGNQTTDIDLNTFSGRLNLGLSWFPFN